MMMPSCCHQASTVVKNRSKTKTLNLDRDEIVIDRPEDLVDLANLCHVLQVDGRVEIGNLLVGTLHNQVVLIIDF